MRRFLLLFPMPLLLANAVPVAIPPDIKAMLDAAMTAGNDAEVSTLVKYGDKAAPDSAKAINAYADAWRSEKQHQHEVMVEQADFLSLWTGKAQVGGWLTTGNSPNLGVSASVDLERDGILWRHKLHLQADYQRSLGVTTREHYLASYEPNYKIDDRAYLYGSGSFESDRILGYYDRFSFSVGGGYSVIKRPSATLDLELGPAFRATHYTDETDQDSPAIRGSMDFSWKLTHALSFTQNASAYYQRYNSTISGTSALNAKLIGPLSAQLSYNIQYESEPPAGSVSTDQTSRASLVYDF